MGLDLHHGLLEVALAPLEFLLARRVLVEARTVLHVLHVVQAVLGQSCCGQNGDRDGFVHCVLCVKFCIYLRNLKFDSIYTPF